MALIVDIVNQKWVSLLICQEQTLKNILQYDPYRLLLTTVMKHLRLTTNIQNG